MQLNQMLMNKKKKKNVVKFILFKLILLQSICFNLINNYSIYIINSNVQLYNKKKHKKSPSKK